MNLITREIIISNAAQSIDVHKVETTIDSVADWDMILICGEWFLRIYAQYERNVCVRAHVIQHKTA